MFLAFKPEVVTSLYTGANGVILESGSWLDVSLKYYSLYTVFRLEIHFCSRIINMWMVKMRCGEERAK